MRRWAKIAEKMPGRSAHMCRERWCDSRAMREARDAHEAANPLVAQHRDRAGALLRKPKPQRQHAAGQQSAHRPVPRVIPPAPLLSAAPLPAVVRLEERRARDSAAATTIQRLTSR